MFICVPKVGGEKLALPSRSNKGGSMAEVIDFEDLKKDSGDLKNLQDSDLQKLSNNIQKLLDLDKTIEELEETIKEFKRERAIVSEETIPQQMQELGISDTTMADGSKIILKKVFIAEYQKIKLKRHMPTLDKKTWVT